MECNADVANGKAFAFLLTFREQALRNIKKKKKKTNSLLSSKSEDWGYSYLVDPTSSHMLVSKIKPCISKYKDLYCETANGSLNQLSTI